MTVELIYWLILGVICAVPFIIGILMMRRTMKLGNSFVWSMVVSGLITGVSCLWWWSLHDDLFTIRLGIVFYIIAWVNVGVILLFALLSMRKVKTNKNDRRD